MRTVSVLLVVLLSATCARFDSDSFLMTDVNGYTLDSAGSLVRFNAIAIRNGRVLAMGSAVR